jgi:hypothetical protein
MITPQGTIKVKKGVIVNQQEFRQHLGAYITVMGGNAAKLLKKQARLFCDDMLDYTMPFAGGMGQDGRSKSAQKLGMAVVNSQIKNIFLPLQYVGAGEILQYGNEGVFSAWLRARKKLSNPMIPDWLKDSSGMSSLWTKFQKWEFAIAEAEISPGLIDLSTYGKTSNIKSIQVGGNNGSSSSIIIICYQCDTTSDDGDVNSSCLSVICDCRAACIINNNTEIGICSVIYSSSIIWNENCVIRIQICTCYSASSTIWVCISVATQSI